MRITSRFVPSLVTLVTLAGCASSVGERTSSSDEAVICTVNSDPTKPCKKGPPPKVIPDVTYFTATTTETSAHLSFLTQNGNTSPDVAIGYGFTPNPPALLIKNNHESSVSHDYDITGLQPCQAYWYEIRWDGEVRDSGYFTLQSPALTFDTTRIAYNRVQVHAHTSIPLPVALHVHQAQAVPTDADYDANMSDPGGLDHWYSFALNGPRYELSTPTCTRPAIAPVAFDDWPQGWGAHYQPAATGVDAPGDVTTHWSDEAEVQGIAHDDRGNWLVANKFHIYQVPYWRSLSDSMSATGVIGSIPADLYAAGYNHIGDLDFSGGYTFAPLEDKDTSQDPYVLVFDRNLTLVLRQKIARGATFEVPWVAVNPIDGLLYTSIFEVSGAPGHGFRRFQIARDATGKPTSLNALDELVPWNGANTMAVHRVQGGVFSPMGHLYVVDDADASVGGEGIYGFDVAGGSAQYRAYQFIDYKPGTHGGLGGFEELEGLDLWDMSDGRAPGIGGQLHVLMAEAGSDYWIKHYEVRGSDGSASPSGIWAL